MNDISNTQQEPADMKIFQAMQEKGNFQITPCDSAMDLEDKSRFRKMEFSSGQKMQMSALLHQVPALAVGKQMSNVYVVRFPEGLPHTLTKLKQGGFGTMLRGEDGRFVGTASLYALDTHAQAMMLNAFTVMSVVTSQYFLAEINDKMQMMQLKLDKILEFLYGDKKAELLAESSFVKFAYQNYQSIMAHEGQRVATIGSLQQAKKVAMKDIEFYLGDLDSTVNGEGKLEQRVHEALQIRECLAFSMQLYTMSNLLELYYADNHDKSYIQYLEEDMTFYISKCDSRMLKCFSSLNSQIREYKPLLGSKVDKEYLLEKTGEIVDALTTGEKSPLRQTITMALHAGEQENVFYLNRDGSVYTKAG